MEGGILEPEKARFQEELSKWFESRGIIADLRSHLRHLMITALQNTRIGPKPAESASPKAQAVNLIVAEYLHRHRCHYALSVFASEVPALGSFSCVDPGSALRGEARPRRRPQDNWFQEREVEEIFNALGMPSCAEELRRLKESYLRKGNESSLLELFLQSVFQLATKLQIRQSSEGFGQQVCDGERLLSDVWSSRVVDVLLSEGMKPPQITAVQQAILRITEKEVQRIAEEERRSRMQALAEREKRIQEYLRKHEDGIFLRIMEAERDLTTRKDIIDEELSQRQRHLTRMVLEWSSKHEEILSLSRNFHSIETENAALRKRLEELEAENRSLGEEGEQQNRTIDGLQREMSCLADRLKQVTESNAVLSERIEVLIGRENKEASPAHDAAKQGDPAEDPEEIPLLWSRNRPLADEGISAPRQARGGARPRESGVRVHGNSPEEVRAEGGTPELSDDSEDEGESSSEEIITNVRKKVHDLEEESNRINKNYLECKLRWLSADTDSDSSRNLPEKVTSSPKDAGPTAVLKQTKCSQTNGDGEFLQPNKPEEAKDRKTTPEQSPPVRSLLKKTEEVSQGPVAARAPTKRQLQNREFFLHSRQLLQELERENVDELRTTTPSSFHTSGSSSPEDSVRPRTRTKKPGAEPAVVTPLMTASFYCNEEPPVERKASGESVRTTTSANLPKTDANCLALLEDARIKSPRDGKPLRQQILLSELEEGRNPEWEKQGQSKSVASPASASASTGKVSAGKESGTEGFW